MMYLSKKDINVFYHQVYANVAKKVDSENYEWKSASELADELNTEHPKIAKKIDVFIKAYENWFKVHQDIDEAGSSGKLSQEENQRLQTAKSERDQSRKTLISDLENFKQAH